MFDGEERNSRSDLDPFLSEVFAHFDETQRHFGESLHMLFLRFFALRICLKRIVYIALLVLKDYHFDFGFFAPTVSAVNVFSLSKFMQYGMSLNTRRIYVGAVEIDLRLPAVLGIRTSSKFDSSSTHLRAQPMPGCPLTSRSLSTRRDPFRTAPQRGGVWWLLLAYESTDSV